MKQELSCLKRVVLVICGQPVLNTTQNLTASCGLEVLPTEFGQLTRLTSLDLFDNSLTALPTEFFKLTQLTSLGLGENNLEQLPTEFFKLTQLKEFDLMSNSLEQLPTEFGQLTQLTWLALDANSLEQLPTEFGQLSQLTWLALGANSLEALPTEFGYLAQLTSLDLLSNGLEQLPTEFGQFSQLTWLALGANSLEALPTEFGHLAQLTSLDLSANNLEALPTEFGHLAQLTSLDLSANNLEALPTEFGHLAQLTTLDLGPNSLDVLPTEFGQLTQLTWLDLLSNSLEELPTEFGQLTQLTALWLRRNSLEALPTEFGQLTQLVKLDLGSTNLEALPTEFFKLTQLATLDLGPNSLEALPTEFGQLTQLTLLDLNANSLEALPTEFGHLAQLTILWLTQNSLEQLPTEFGHLAQLTMLALGANSLEQLPTEFGHLAQLTALDLALSRLEALPTEFGQLTQLTWLELLSNSLEELPTEFGKLTRLTSLGLDQNSLDVLPTEFGQLTQLAVLDIRGNSLKVLPFRPTNLTVSIVRSKSIDLTWFPPVQLPSVKYEATVTSEGVTKTYLSFLGQTVMTINLLQQFPNVALQQGTFTIQVRAEFEGGYRSLYSKQFNVTTCPAFMERENTNEVEECYALAGFYRNRSGLPRSCIDLERDLPPGAIGQCLKARLDIKDLPIQEDFWRASLSSEDIRLCPDAQFCTQRWSNMSSASPDRYCEQYHSGTYCSDCAKDNVLGSEGCTFCTKEARESTEQLVLLVCALLLLFCLLYVYVLYSAGCFNLKKKLACRRGSRRHNSERMPCCKKLSAKVLIWTKVRILFGYFQVLSSYRRTFLRQTLTESGDLLGVMALVSNVDVTWLVGNAAFRCFYDYNHYDLLLAVTVGPIVLAVLLFACTTTTAYCMVRRLLKAVRDHTESAVLLLLFLIYPYVSQTVLGTFWCESFPDADRRFNLTTSALRADYRLSCEHDVDPERFGFEIYAGVMVVVYPVGVVALYTWVLYVHKDSVMAFGDNTTGRKEDKEKLRKVSFLIKPYKVKRFWFEAYELVRKLMQTSFVGFLTGLPVELPGFLAANSLSLTVVFVLSLALLQPYKHLSDFAFAVISLLLLLPASLYSLLDPYARHEGISNAGLEALVITELCVFALFVVFEFACAVGVGLVKKGSCCADGCLSGEGGGVETQGSGDGGVGDKQESDVIPLIAKKRIAELEALLECSKAEIGRLRDENVALIQSTDDRSETSIQAI